MFKTSDHKKFKNCIILKFKNAIIIEIKNKLNLDILKFKIPKFKTFLKNSKNDRNIKLRP